MSSTLTTTTSLRVTSRTLNCTNQCRHASLLRRPRRPYTFTQLITLSDGSAFLTRTTSPVPILKTTKDIKNHPLWNPSSQKLLNVEEDEAGRLKAFRGRFGRGWDAESTNSAEDGKEGGETGQGEEDSLLDLIAGFSRETQTPPEKKKKPVVEAKEEEVSSKPKRKSK